MGLDETLLENAGGRPTLRLYTWEPDTLSLGYFQRFAEVPAVTNASAVVRRITGGGAIHHTGELTWSITTAADDPLYRGPIAESYRRVHGIILAALHALGIEASLREASPLASDRPGTGMCFHASTPLDIIWSGAKGMGSAQRRRRGRVLHHGSIKLAPSELEAGVAAASHIDVETMGRALVSAFEERLGICCEPEGPRPAELREALRRGERFTSEAWLHRR